MRGSRCAQRRARPARRSSTASSIRTTDACSAARGSTKSIGRIAVCNLGYWVRPSAQRRGVATRAVRLLLAEAFGDAGMRRVEIVVAVGNEASEAVARNAGGLLECIARNRVAIGDVSHPASVFSFVPP